MISEESIEAIVALFLCVIISLLIPCQYDMAIKMKEFSERKKGRQ